MQLVVCLCLELQARPGWRHLSPRVGEWQKSLLDLFFLLYLQTLTCATWLSAPREVTCLIIFQLIRRWHVSSSVQRWSSTRNLTCRHRKLMPISHMSWTIDTGILYEHWALRDTNITFVRSTRSRNVNVVVTPGGGGCTIHTMASTCLQKGSSALNVSITFSKVLFFFGKKLHVVSAPFLKYFMMLPHITLRSQVKQGRAGALL